MIGTVADEIRYWAHLQYDPADENGPLDHYYGWIRALVEKMKNTGGSGRSYMYYFAKGYERGVHPGEDYMKACHACEVTYALNNTEYSEGAPFDPVLTKRFSNIFVNFARTGNPGIEGLDVPEYEKNNRSTIVVGRDAAIRIVQNCNL